MNKNGQTLIEFVILGALLLAFSLLSIFFFGDKIADLFEENNVLAMFGNKSRIAKQDYVLSYSLSESTINIGGQAKKAPLESIIRAQMLNAATATAAGNGQIQTLIATLFEYTNQMEKIVENDLPQNANSSSFKEALNSYCTEIKTYQEKDNTLVSGSNDPLIKLVNDLDISVDLGKDGITSKKLQAAANELIAGLPEGEVKSLFKIYTQDMLNLGQNIDYYVDSRLAQEFELDNTGAESDESDSQELSINIINQWQNNVIEYKEIAENDHDKNLKLNEVSNKIRQMKNEYTEGDADNRLNRDIEEVIREIDRSLQEIEEERDYDLRYNSDNEDYNDKQERLNQIQNYITTIRNNLSNYLDPENVQTSNISDKKILLNKLKEIQEDPNISYEEKVNLAKRISVYTKNTYKEILPDSYNTKVLLNTLNNK